MPTKLVITIFAAALVVTGVLLWWILAQPSSVPAGTVQTGSNVGPVANINNQTSVSGGSPAKSIDFKKEYGVLFSGILARKLEFTKVSAAGGTAGSVYALYAEDVAEARTAYPTETDLSVSVAFVDLTDDGVDEAVVLDTLPGACGTAGCPLDIYRKQGTAWSPLYSNLVIGEVGISNTITNDHIDLFLTVKTGIRYPYIVSRFVWDGSTYAQGEMMAYWDNDRLIKR